ncbi:unnamed protein product [Owenia fusiformis]|uniref:Uncharacterized protein n=1 Tax=Owenia fusiformis TaxID=6347 RepID=A0A8J1T686_OWEFU|nr:unnamed protein product [Owenia fusiformis]
MDISFTLALIIGLYTFNQAVSGSNLRERVYNKVKNFAVTADPFKTHENIKSALACGMKCTSDCCFMANFIQTTKRCLLFRNLLHDNTGYVNPDITKWEQITPSQGSQILYTKSIYRDCQEIYNTGCDVDAVYTIQPNMGQPPFNIQCDMTSGGWDIIQRRIDGAQDFHFQTWDAYKQGFGDLQTEYWLGNDKIHILSNSGNYMIDFDLRHPNGNWFSESYDNFEITDESDKYRLTIGNAIGGDAGDSIHGHGAIYDPGNMQFSTIDRDNDGSGLNCAEALKGGGWWYSSCGRVKLNAVYSSDGEYDTGNKGLNWHNITKVHLYAGQYASIMETVMKLKQVLP